MERLASLMAKDHRFINSPGTTAEGRGAMLEGGKVQRAEAEAEAEIMCPVCGAATVQEKCKVICKSDLCRGRVVYNCAEF